jgi:hypothetical protein
VLLQCNIQNFATIARQPDLSGSGFCSATILKDQSNMKSSLLVAALLALAVSACGDAQQTVPADAAPAVEAPEIAPADATPAIEAPETEIAPVDATPATEAPEAETSAVQ